MADRQKRLKENIGANLQTSNTAHGKAYQGTPQKSALRSSNPTPHSLPITPSRPSSGSASSRRDVTRNTQVDTPVASKTAQQQSTPVPNSKSASAQTSRVAYSSSALTDASTNESDNQHTLDYTASEAFEVVEEIDLFQQDLDEEDPVDEEGVVEEELIIEPSDLVRAENEDWQAWDHDTLAEHACNMNLALIQLAEDIAQWRLHCSRLNKNGQELYTQYVQQCHRLQRTSTLLKQSRRENAELSGKLSVAESAVVASEQKLATQQERLKSNLEACQMMKDSLTVANRRIKELDAAKSAQNEAVERALSEREAALESAVQLAHGLSNDLEVAAARIDQLEVEKEAISKRLESALEAAKEEKDGLNATIQTLQRENEEYSRQIDSLAETPGMASLQDMNRSEETAHFTTYDGVISPTATTANNVTSSSTSTTVPETPSKRNWLLASGSSPQKRVEALSIRVETLRAHNAKLEESLARQEKAMKLQLEEATQSEHRWKMEARRAQVKVEELVVELDAANLSAETLREEMNCLHRSAKLSDEYAEKLSNAEKNIKELLQTINTLEEGKRSAEEREQMAQEKLQTMAEVESQLGLYREELEYMRSAQKQAEDDMRLLYLQHKQEKESLEATYKHEDYKSRYADAVQRASTLHQKLTHVLQFIATNQHLAQLAAETPDLSNQESLSGAWMSDLTGAPQPQTPNCRASGANANLKSTPRKATIASSSPFASPMVVSSSQRRSSLAVTAGRTPKRSLLNAHRRSSMAPLQLQQQQQQQQHTEPQNGERDETASLVKSLIDTCGEWKKRSTQLAERVLCLESLLVKERSDKLETIQRMALEHSDQLQNHIDALHISHDAQIRRYESELEAQSALLGAHAEAYETLQSTYSALCDEFDKLTQKLHETSADLLTYRSVYEETKKLTAEQFASEKSEMENTIAQLNACLQEEKDTHENLQQRLKHELGEKEEMLAFLESEIQGVRESSNEARAQLLEEHSNQVSSLEVKIDTQQVHIETLETKIDKLKAQCVDLEVQLEEKSAQLSHCERSIIVLSLTAQCLLADTEKMSSIISDQSVQITTVTEAKDSLESDLEISEILLGRAKGTMVMQHKQIENLRNDNEVLQRAMELWKSSHAQMEEKLRETHTAHERVMSDAHQTMKNLEATVLNLTQARDLLDVQLKSESQQFGETESLLRNSLTTANTKLEQLSSELSETQAQLLTVRAEKEEMCAQWSAEVADSANKIESLNLELSAKLVEISTLKQAIIDADSRLEHLKHQSETEKQIVSAKVSADMNVILESLTRESACKQSEIEKLSAEVEVLRREVDLARLEKGRCELELERKTVDLTLTLQANQVLETSRNQLETVIQTLETSQRELESANGALENTIELERDEKQKLCHKIESLQEMLSTQALQISQLQKQQQSMTPSLTSSTSTLSSLTSSQNNLLHSSGSILNNANGASSELDAMHVEHHEWLNRMRESLQWAIQLFSEEIVAKGVEMDQELAACRARINELENILQQRIEENDTLADTVKKQSEDLLVAKNSHCTLILQNGMLSSLIMMAHTAGIATGQTTSQSSPSSSSSSNISTNAHSAMEMLAKEHGFVPDMKEVLKLKRQCQSLLLKAQQYEDENKQLKTKLSESKLALYEREDYRVSQLTAFEVRCRKTEKRLKAAEQMKLQLFVFLGQIRESLVRHVQFPAIRELLRQWAPSMNVLLHNGLPNVPTTTSSPPSNQDHQDQAVTVAVTSR